MLAGAILAGALLLGSLILSSGAAAKDFRPGDLSVCNATRCVSIESRPALTALSAFYYDGSVRPSRIRAPRLGAPFFRLEFSDGYVTGIVAGTQLSRFLSYGVNLEQFRARAWYRVPTGALAGVRELTRELTPLRLTRAALAGAPTSGIPTPEATQTPHRSPSPRRSQRAATVAGDGTGLPWSVLAVLILVALVGLATLARRLLRR